MFGKGLKLFTLFGYEVRIDPSWLLLAVLVTWSLAHGLFPFYFEDFSTATYWWMGVAGAIGLFVSIVFHEFSHSLIARRHGIPVKGITLFIFGGIAQMDEEPQTAKGELLMAVAGPIASVVLGAAFFILHLFAAGIPWPKPVDGVLVYLASINVILALFNMIPAFPLDGGRVLRSILWKWKNDLRWATRISSRIGAGFGIVLIVLGAIDFIAGNFIGGVWLALIGFFLRGISQSSYQQVLVRNALKGEPVRRFMRENPVTLKPSTTVRDLVEEYFYKYHHKFYPVRDDSQELACISLDKIKAVPKENWNRQTVGDLAESCSDENMVRADTDAIDALKTMRKTGKSRLMVVDNGSLVGVIALKDMLEFLSLKAELEEEST